MAFVISAHQTRDEILLNGKLLIVKYVPPLFPDVFGCSLAAYLIHKVFISIEILTPKDFACDVMVT